MLPLRFGERAFRHHDTLNRVNENSFFWLSRIIYSSPYYMMRTLLPTRSLLTEPVVMFV